jgi:hypothetical protein
MEHVPPVREAKNIFQLIMLIDEFKTTLYKVSNPLVLPCTHKLQAREVTHALFNGSQPLRHALRHFPDLFRRLAADG